MPDNIAAAAIGMGCGCASNSAGTPPRSIRYDSRRERDSRRPAAARLVPD